MLPLASPLIDQLEPGCAHSWEQWLATTLSGTEREWTERTGNVSLVLSAPQKPLTMGWDNVGSFVVWLSSLKNSATFGHVHNASLGFWFHSLYGCAYALYLFLAFLDVCLIWLHFDLNRMTWFLKILAYSSNLSCRHKTQFLNIPSKAWSIHFKQKLAIRILF